MTDLEAAALASKTLRQVRALTEWVGAGRKLTQRGNLTLADARNLVTLLETADEMDPEIGDRRWRTQSSEDLRELNAVLIWAKRVGLVRIHSGRLVAVKSKARLLARPLELWTRLFSVFDDLVDAVCPPGYLPSLLAEDFPDGVRMLFYKLAERDGAIRIADALDAVWDGLAHRFHLPPSVLHSGVLRSTTPHEIRHLITTLIVLGALGEEPAETVRITELAEWALRREYDLDQSIGMVAQLKITLEHVEPLIWRRVIVPMGRSLRQLHDVIQAAMGWQDRHLHMFIKGDERYGFSDPDFPLIDDRAIPVDHVLRAEGDAIEYEYDFGDSWDHRVELEKLMPAARGVAYPVFIDGERACPPEDCGGYPGYRNLLQALADPKHEDHDDLSRWMRRHGSDPFDPEQFEVADANERFTATGRRRTG